MSYPNTDTLLLPVLQGLATVCGQVQGIGQVYIEAPEGPPDDNGVLLPVKRWRILNWTNGTAEIEWTIEVTHVFRRANFGDDLARAQTFIAPWLLALSSLSNTSLNDAAILCEPQSGQFVSYVHAGQPYLALVHQVHVLTEFTLPR